MHLTEIIGLLLLTLVVGISLPVGLHAWQRRQFPGAAPLALMAAGVILWSLGAGGFLFMNSGEAAQYWVALQFLSLSVLPPCWLAFTLQFTGRPWKFGQGTIFSVVVIGLSMASLVATNGQHFLVWHDSLINGKIQSEPSVLYWLFISYGYLLTFTGLVILFEKTVSASGIYRRQNGIILLAGLAPLLINLPTLTGLLPKWRIDPTLPGFAISITLMWWGLFRLEILDLIPVAHSVLLENLRDGMLVIDTQNRIVDINPMAQRVLGISSGPFIGQQAGERLIHWNPLRQVCCSDSSNPGETILEDNEQGLYLEARVTPLTDQYGRPRGHLILVRDISEQHRARLERETLIRELQTALGQVKTLSGLLPICAGCKKIRDQAGEWHKLESYLHHHTEAQLTHGLCPSCIEELYPGV